MCPKGDDPLTLFTVYRTVVITTTFTFGQSLSGYFRFSFEGSSFKFPKDPRVWTGDACIAAFQGLPAFNKVLCTQSISPSASLISSFSGSATYTVQFKRFPADPHQNNIYYHEGDPNIGHFTCTHVDTSSVFIGSWSGTTLTVASVSSGALGVGQEISGLGITAGTTISAVLTPHGTGTYVMSAASLASGTNVPITLTGSAQFTASWGVGVVLTVTQVAAGKLAVGQSLVGPHVIVGSVITAQLSGTTGGIGSYKMSVAQTTVGTGVAVTSSAVALALASWTAGSSTLSVTSISSGAVAVGQAVSGAGLAAGSTIVTVTAGGNGLGIYTIAAQQAAGFGVSMASSTGACSVEDAAVSNGYVYPGKCHPNLLDFD